jgi:hypothetical protein
MTIPNQSARAREVISELIRKLNISKDLLSSLTREDINYLRGRLDLLEYLITPTSGPKIEPPERLAPMPCSVCGHKPIPRTVYHYRDEWYCAEHFPLDVTWPVGMHGDDLKAYKERK